MVSDSITEENALGTSPTYHERRRKLLEKKLTNKLKSIKWRAIIRSLRVVPSKRDAVSGKKYRSIIIGSRTMLTPSEKFYSSDSDRRSELEKEIDSKWWELLDAQAKEHGLQLMLKWNDGEPIVVVVKKED